MAVSVWSSHHQGGFVHCEDNFVKSQMLKIEKRLALGQARLTLFPENKDKGEYDSNEECRCHEENWVKDITPEPFR